MIPKIVAVHCSHGRERSYFNLGSCLVFVGRGMFDGEQSKERNGRKITDRGAECVLLLACLFNIRREANRI